jgi:xanthine dehydrogenase accessory factor
MDRDDTLQRAMEMQASGRPFAWITVVRAVAPTSATVGAKMIVEADGAFHGWIGGGCVKAVIQGVALDAIRTGRSRLVRISPDETPEEPGVDSFLMSCASGGTVELFVEAFVSAPLVLVAGGSPTGLAVVHFAERVGLRVAHADSEGRFAVDALFRISAYEGPLFSAMQPRWCVVATQGEGDGSALEAAMQTGAERVFLVASNRKAAKLFAELRERGRGSEELDSRIEAPAGLPIGAAMPEEIGLSIAARLVQLRRSGDDRPTRPTDWPQGDAETGETPERAALPESGAPIPSTGASASVVSPVYGAIDPVCGKRVEAKKAVRISYQGRSYYFCCLGCRAVFELLPEHYLRQRMVQQG